MVFSLIGSDIDTDNITPHMWLIIYPQDGSPLIQPIIIEAITNEQVSGACVKCSDELKIISALFAIPKPYSGIRLIQVLINPNN